MSRKTELNKAQTDALEAIDNFILYFTSDEAERERMSAAALDYIEQEHAEWVEHDPATTTDPVGGARALPDGDYRLTDEAAWVEVRGLALRIRTTETGGSLRPRRKVAVVTVYEHGREDEDHIDEFAVLCPEQGGDHEQT